MSQTKLDSLNSEMKHRFTHHPPKDTKQTDIYYNFRTMGHELAMMIIKHCPDCRERENALAKIEEAIMWANAGIARRT